MPEQPQPFVPHYRPLSLAAGSVGTWRSSVVDQTAFCDLVMAGMMGLSEAEAEHGFPFSRIRDVIHPDDRAVFDAQTSRDREAGPFVMEYRIILRPGGVRRVLIRGRYDKLPNSVGVTGHGIAVDITAVRTGGVGEAGQAYAVRTPDPEPSNALRRAGDAAIALRREADHLGESVPTLRVLADLALYAIGQELAGRTIPDDLN